MSATSSGITFSAKRRGMSERNTGVYAARPVLTADRIFYATKRERSEVEREGEREQRQEKATAEAAPGQQRDSW